MEYNDDNDEDEIEFIEEELQELEEAFNLFAIEKHTVDEETNELPGILSVRDLTSTMKELGFVLTEAEVFTIIDEVDHNKTGFIDFEKFAYIVKKNTKTMDEDELTLAFAVFDIDVNGHISTKEITHITRCLGMLYREEEVDDMLKEVDTDGDGRISFDDFVYFMTKY